MLFLSRFCATLAADKQENLPLERVNPARDRQGCYSLARGVRLKVKNSRARDVGSDQECRHHGRTLINRKN
jgi:hypothetical protein